LGYGGEGGACCSLEGPPRHAVAVNPLIAFCETHLASLITQNAVAGLNQRCLESGTTFWVKPNDVLGDIHNPVLGGAKCD
jgi:hypothetical protein